jgi:glycosyltransferase involved in cell wall biosynthesis
MADGVQGRVADTPGGFASAVIEVLQDDELATRLGSAGRDHVERHFGWERMGQQLVELVGELLHTRAPHLSSAGASR